MVILSILICHLKERGALLERLMARLTPQLLASNDSVEILVESDDGEKKSGVTTGAKRNTLLERAKGEYICFVDDDDLVDENYCAKIIEATKTKPDVVGMSGLIYIDIGRPRTFIHSLEYKKWEAIGELYVRFPNHLNPVKRELALQAGFPSITSGEDKAYSDRLLPLIKTQVMIDGPIYHYYP